MSSYNILVYKKRDNTYYARKYRHVFPPHELGYINSYGHEVVLIINDLQEIRVFSRPRLNRKIKSRLINIINKM